jgi:hypothetical protein
MEPTTVLALIFISAVILAVLGILLVLFTHKTSSPAQQPLFRPLTGVNQADGPHGTGENARMVQFVPMPSLAAVGMRAAAGRRTKGQSPHLVGAVTVGPVCWTTGMSRTGCRCSNCLSRRKPR